MKTLVHLFVLLFAISAGAQGRVEAISSFGAPDVATAYQEDGTSGFGFMPYVDLTVLDIGVFDSVLQQLENPVTVGIWNSAGDLIASESISSLSPIFNGTRYATLSSEKLLLGSQNYFIGAYVPQVASVVLVGEGFGGSAAMSPAIRYLGWARVDSTALTQPVLVSNGSGVTPGIVNFQHRGVPVPEPGALSFFLIGLAALAFSGKRA